MKTNTTLTQRFIEILFILNEGERVDIQRVT